MESHWDSDIDCHKPLSQLESIIITEGGESLGDSLKPQTVTGKRPCGVDIVNRKLRPRARLTDSQQAHQRVARATRTYVASGGGG